MLSSDINVVAVATGKLERGGIKSGDLLNIAHT